MSDSQNKDPGPAYRTAAEVVAEQPGATEPELKEGDSRSGLTVVRGLQHIEGSTAPSRLDGKPMHHVMGPGQNPVDAVAAGLDTRYIGHSLQGDGRVVTQTGEIGAGPRPFTYVEKTGPDMVQQAAPADGATVAAPPPAPPLAQPVANAAAQAPKPASAPPPAVPASAPGAAATDKK